MHLDTEDLMDEMARAKLEMVGLSSATATSSRPVLSGAPTKHVALARVKQIELSFSTNTSGLDPISAGDFDELIRTLQGTPEITVAMVTHDLENLYTACDRIAILGCRRRAALIGDLLECEHPTGAYFQGKRGSNLAPDAN